MKRFFLLLLTFCIASNVGATRIYLNSEATGANNGTSINDAYTNPATAFAALSGGDTLLCHGEFIGLTNSFSVPAGSISARTAIMSCDASGNISIGDVTFSWGDTISGSWTSDGGGIYHMTDPTSNTGGVYVVGSGLLDCPDRGYPQPPVSDPGAREFGLSGGNLYVHLTGGANPNSAIIVVSRDVVPFGWNTGQHPSYITWWGLIMKHCGGMFSWYEPLSSSGEPRDLIIYGCTMIHASKFESGANTAFIAVKSNGTGTEKDTTYNPTGWIIRKNHFEDCTEGNHAGHGSYICLYDISHLIIDSNTFVGSSTGSGVELKGQLVYPNTHPTAVDVQIAFNYFDMTHGAGIVIPWDHQHNCQVYGNLIRSADEPGVAMGGDGMSCVNAVFPSANKIRNNTFVQCGASALPMDPSTYVGWNNELKYNIFYNTTSPVSLTANDRKNQYCSPHNGTDGTTNSSNAQHWIIDDNQFYASTGTIAWYLEGTGSYTVKANWSALEGWDANSTVGNDPGFANPSSFTFAGYMPSNADPITPWSIRGFDFTQAGAVQDEGPVAEFSVTPTSGVEVLEVAFTDESVGDPVSWDWDFGDGQPHSTDQNPVHYYYDAGTYDVTLIISDGVDADTLVKTNYVTVTAPNYTPVSVSTNHKWFALGDSAIVLSGSHTWIGVKDAGPTTSIPTFDILNFFDDLVAFGHNFTKAWSWWNDYNTAETNASHSSPWYYTPSMYKRPGPGNAIDGFLKYDLTQLNSDYFDKLKYFVSEANKRGLIVNIMLFEGWSAGDKSLGSGNPWEGHPGNPLNNINSQDWDTDDDGKGYEIHTDTLGPWWAFQKAYMDSVFSTCDGYMVMYEVANETQSETMDWQEAVVDYAHAWWTANSSYSYIIGITVPWHGDDASSTTQDAIRNTLPNDWWSGNDATGGIGSYSNPNAHSGHGPIGFDTDHLCGLCGDAVYPWRAFLRGNNPWFMDCWDDEYGICSDGPGDTANIRVVLGQVADYGARVDLSVASVQSSLSAGDNYCLADSVNYSYYLAFCTDGTLTMDLSDATLGANDSLIVEWLNVNTGAKSQDYDRLGSGDLSSSVALAAPSGTNFVLYLRDSAFAVTAPVADFSASVISGAPPLSVDFTDLSMNSPTSWDWGWGDETTHGTTQNPTHEYASDGVYTVTLTATNSGGSDDEIKVDYITVTTPAPTVKVFKGILK